MLKLTLYVEDVGKEVSIDKKKTCAACGFPNAKTRRYDGVLSKVRRRKGLGTGRMSYLKTIDRKFKNHFREENVYKKALPEKEKPKDKTLPRSKVPRRKLL